MSAKEDDFRGADIESVRRATDDLKRVAAELNGLPAPSAAWGKRKAADGSPARAGRQPAPHNSDGKQTRR
jgi:hypothetical protein